MNSSALWIRGSELQVGKDDFDAAVFPASGRGRVGGDRLVFAKAGSLKPRRINALLPSGSVTPSITDVRALAIHGTKIFVFGGGGFSYSVEKFELSDFSALQPNTPVNP